MRRHFLRALIVLFVSAPLLGAQQIEALWYATGRASSTRSFVDHADKISAIAPQVFSFDNQGTITGHVDPALIDAAHAKGVKLIPLVMNPGFDQAMVHHIVSSPLIRHKAEHNLAALCREHHFDGIQFDIENINIADKDGFTTFVRESADSLHKASCTLSAAVVPRASENPGPTAFHKWMFENWRGAYDYKALADAMDFISYMTYAQHTGGTTPGPVAGYSWMEDDLKYILSLGVPPAKISLGIPTYSDYWYPTYDTKKGERGSGRDIGFGEAEKLLSDRSLKSSWDDTQKASWAMWSEAGVMDYVWIEDARAFQAKMGLVAKYHLRGYSVWVIGLEDPAVWQIPNLKY